MPAINEMELHPGGEASDYQGLWQTAIDNATSEPGSVVRLRVHPGDYSLAVGRGGTPFANLSTIYPPGLVIEVQIDEEGRIQIDVAPAPEGVHHPPEAPVSLERDYNWSDGGAIV